MAAHFMKRTTESGTQADTSGKPVPNRTFELAERYGGNLRLHLDRAEAAQVRTDWKNGQTISDLKKACNRLSALLNLMLLIQESITDQPRKLVITADLDGKRYKYSGEINSPSVPVKTVQRAGYIDVYPAR